MQSRWHRGVSTVRRERKREGEGEREEERGERRKKKTTRLLLILILHRHTDHAHYTEGDCVELRHTHLIPKQRKPKCGEC